ncbi:MAG TPA: nitric-oxide reductase large subunit [candidate division Zixibacteria bacterium]|nr:nitric-oxide reductase large subunit [candidate division Zixibacteria bacterium]
MNNPVVRAVLLFLLVLTFGVLIFGGYVINREKPPIPEKVVAPDGSTVFTGADILDGQNYYFSRGGQHIGTIWGHGSYLAPDWSADYLHRMGLYIAGRHNGMTKAQAAEYATQELDSTLVVESGTLRDKVQDELKPNRYDPNTGTLTFTEYQAEAFEVLREYYTSLFREGHERMGLQAGIVTDQEQGHNVSSFFAWLAWAAVTLRPDLDLSYTSNWPYDPLVGNQAIPGALIWSIVSVIVLIFVIAVVIFLYLKYMRDDDYKTELVTKFDEPNPTPSQRATLPYFIVAMALFAIQAVLGSITGHFTIEGTHFLGVPIGDILPYAALRTWHIQLAIFWIATCFLATGLFIGPFVGREPKFQAPLTKTLFGAVVIVVLGTLVGSWLSIQGKFGGEGFIFGHQGYEYIELGRLWQLLLIAGMLIWLILVLRAIIPAIRGEKDAGGLTHMLLYSTVSIPLFYMAGLMYGSGSHISDAEYWRWWVVHLWVEGFFEVFATVILAFILSRIGAVSQRFALLTIYFSIFLYLGSGIIGTFHHLYWTGTPTPIMALGAVFSALEIVPLTLLGFEAVHNLDIIKKGGRNYAYKWPVLFFIAVAFWNMLGAGVFGFLINPPIVLYYAQGINTTPIHAHTALFGVYGFLAIALMLFSVRHIIARQAWSDRLLKWSFWTLNGGLLAMTFLSLVPSGFYQFYYAVKFGTWFARSPEIASGPVIRALSIVRIIPDIIFISGAVLIFVFMARGIWLSRRNKHDLESKSTRGGQEVEYETH